MQRASANSSSAASTSYGCAGAGAANTASGTNKAGGAGAPGVVIIWEYA